VQTMDFVAKTFYSERLTEIHRERRHIKARLLWIHRKLNSIEKRLAQVEENFPPKTTYLNRPIDLAPRGLLESDPMSPPSAEAMPIGSEPAASMDRNPSQPLDPRE